MTNISMISAFDQSRPLALYRKGTTMKQRALVLIAAAGLVAATAVAPAAAAGDSVHIEAQDWSFSGIAGKYDKGALQRGLQIYKEVCSACHGLKYLHYRNLGEEGGPGFSESAVKALAAEAEIPDGPDDDGEMFDRPGLPSDSMGSPYGNEQEARAANGGALPPDLSLIAKARGVHRHAPFAVAGWIKAIVTGDETGGADYVYALLNGYSEDVPEDVKVAEGLYYNAAFAGHQIAMPPPLSDDLIEYSDGSPQTVQQYAHDITSFLMWAAEPKLEQRKGLGIRVLIYLVILSVLLYLAKRSVWSRKGH